MQTSTEDPLPRGLFWEWGDKGVSFHLLSAPLLAMGQWGSTVNIKWEQ